MCLKGIETLEATGQMGMLNQLYNLHGLGWTSKHKKIAMTICACAIQNPYQSVCMRVFSLQFLDNQLYLLLPQPDCPLVVCAVHPKGCLESVEWNGGME